jgi:hypothetical protein
MSATPLSACRSASVKRALTDQVRGHASSRALMADRIGQRRHQPFGELAPAAAGHGAVDRLDQAALPRARERAHQFEARPGRRIDEQPRAVAFALGPAQRRPLGNLRLLDIGDGRRCGRQFGARETAETVERAEARKTAVIRPSAVALSNRTAGCGRRHPAELVDQRPDFRIVEHVLGQDQVRAARPARYRPAAAPAGFRRHGTRRWKCRSRPARTAPRPIP